jgi:hypothetical protein
VQPPSRRGASGAASAAFDGRWSVIISTRSGPCDPQYRFGVSVASGPNAANGQGRLMRDYGTGTWRGQGPGGVCSGAWQAWRQ